MWGNPYNVLYEDPDPDLEHRNQSSYIHTKTSRDVHSSTPDSRRWVPWMWRRIDTWVENRDYLSKYLPKVRSKLVLF